MVKPLVTVVITTYNRSFDMVMRALKSAMMQDESDTEVLIIDDNPPGLREKHALYNHFTNSAVYDKDRIRYIAHDENLGACAARNTGIKNARGGFICFLDDDDEYHPDKLKKQLSALGTDKSIGFAACDYAIKNDKTGRVRHVRLDYDTDKMRVQLFGANRIATPNPLIRRECFDVCGNFDERMPSSQDVELWIRILKSYRAVIVHEELYTQHIHGGERITTNGEKKLGGVERLIEKNKELLEHEREAYGRMELMRAKRLIQTGRRREALAGFFKGVSLYPPHILKYLPMMFYWEYKYGKRG